MNILVVVGNPNPASFCHAMGAFQVSAIRFKNQHNADVSINLYPDPIS